MQHVVDIELWSSPKSSPHPLDGKSVAEDCCAATLVPESVVLGLNFVPDETDVQVLAWELSKDEARMHEFEEFCRSHALAFDPGDAKSAAHFLAFAEGQPLAWLHFPASAEGRRMAATVFKWASANGHVIRRMQGESALGEAELHALWPD